MLLFYSGAFAYVGQIEFGKEGCKCGEVVKAKELSNISAAIPLFEEDASNVIGKETQAGLEVDPEKLPSILMQFAEYYLAVKLIQENPDVKIVILDRTLAGDVGHLIWSVREFIKENNCVLEGLSTDFGIVTSLDLELARILNPNIELGIPAPRSQFNKYAINTLISTESDGKTQNIQDYQTLLQKVGAESGRLGKLVNDMTLFNQQYSFFENGPGNDVLKIKSQVSRYWERVFAATMKIAEHIFEPPKGKHPLNYEGSYALETVNEDVTTTKVRKWITSIDLEYMTLIMIYGLIRLAWEKNILIIGLIKDTSASELIKTVVPLLRNAKKMSLGSDLPKFNSDKQLLQTYSVVWKITVLLHCFINILKRI